MDVWTLLCQILVCRPLAEFRPELWIGLVDLKTLDRQTYGAAGAFTNIVTWAGDLDGFRCKTELIAATLEMFVADV